MTGLSHFLRAAALFACVAAAAASEAETADQPVSSAPSVTVAPAIQREIAETITVTGSLAPREEIAVGVDVNGLKILDFFAEEGDVVKAGQLLAVLDSDTIDVSLAQAESQAARAEAGVAQARAAILEAEAAKSDADSALERSEALRRRGVASEEQLDQARNAAARADARLTSAKQGLSVAEADRTLAQARKREVSLQLSKTQITAPRGGLVIARSALIGAIASPAGGPLFRIARDGEIELRAETSEIDLARLASGMSAKVYPAGAEDPAQGEVRLISPEIDPRTRLGEVRISIRAHPQLRVGAFARAEIERERRAGVVIPASAISVRDGVAFAQVVADGAVQTRIIDTGLRDSEGVEILNGVEAGEQVVLRAGAFLQDGDRVNAILAGEPK